MVTIGEKSRRSRTSFPSWVTALIVAFLVLMVGLLATTLHLGISVSQKTKSTEATAATRVDTKSNKVDTKSATPPLIPNQEKQKKPATKNPKLLTYGRFGGRLNNQLFQFVSALQHATVLNRTLVVPPEHDMVRWTGLVDKSVVDLWDLDELNEHYDIDWDTARQEPLQVDDEQCQIPDKGKFTILTTDVDKYKDCPVLHIGGARGLLFARQNHRFNGRAEHEWIAYDIYRRLHPSAALQRIVTEFESTYPYSVAVHSRTHGDPPYPAKMCVNGNVRVCRPHIETNEQRDVWCDNHTLTIDCAKWMETDIVSQIRSKKATQELGNTPPQKFVLANDMTHDWSLDFPKDQFAIISNQAFMQEFRQRLQTLGNPALVSQAGSPYVKQLLSKNIAEFEKNVDRLSQILLELWSLIKPKYMIGNVFSTLSLAACMIRGEERKYDSSMCWLLMHPQTSHAVPPPA